MSDKSPAFNPPVNTVKDSDPMIVRVPMDRTDIGFRPSQRPTMKDDHFAINHVPNGK